MINSIHSFRGLTRCKILLSWKGQPLFMAWASAGVSEYMETVDLYSSVMTPSSESYVTAVGGTATTSGDMYLRRNSF